MSRSLMTGGALLGLALCLLGAVAVAGDASPGSAARADADASAAASTAGLSPSGRVLYLDPATGKVYRQRPTKRRTIEIPAERLAGLRWSHADVRFMTRPEGTQVAWHPGGFQSALVATIGPDGRLTMTHVSGEDTDAPADEAPEAAREERPAAPAREARHE